MNVFINVFLGTYDLLVFIKKNFGGASPMNQELCVEYRVNKIVSILQGLTLQGDSTFVCKAMCTILPSFS